MAADTIVTGSKLTTIANAIRSKTGGSSQLTLDQMATEVAGITGTDRLKNRIMALTYGDTYDYDLVASDFPAEGIDAFAFYQDQHIRDVVLPADNPNITEITSTMFLGSNLRSLTLPPRTDGCWFASCYGLERIDLSEVASVTRYSGSSGMFSGCSHLTDVQLPYSAQFGVFAQDFSHCSSLRAIELPDGATASTSSNTSGLFRNCTGLKTADLGTGIAALNGSSYGTASFSGCTSIERIILRKSDAMVTLSSQGYLFATSSSNVVPARLEGIYVPDGLVATYKADACWSLWSDYIKAMSDL